MILKPMKVRLKDMHWHHEKQNKIQHSCQRLTCHLFQQDFLSAKVHIMSKVA